MAFNRECKLKTFSGTWTVRLIYGKEWQIIDHNDEIVGRFKDAMTMGIHLAGLMEELQHVRNATEETP